MKTNVKMVLIFKDSADIRSLDEGEVLKEKWRKWAEKEGAHVESVEVILTNLLEGT